MANTAHRHRLTAILVATPLVIGAIGLTVLRAPGTTVEGYGSPIGIDTNGPSQSYVAAVEDFPVKIDGKSFTAGELGVNARELPTIHRAWSFGQWGKDYSATLGVDEATKAKTLSELAGYDAPKDATVAYTGTWKVTPSTAGRKLSADLPKEVTTAMRSGEKSLSLKLDDSPPSIPTESAQKVADRLNGASVAVYGGSTKVATLSGAELAKLVSVEDSKGTLKLAVDSKAVDTLATSYSASLKSTRVDGEEITGDDGKALKIITASTDGFTPGSSEEISKGISTSLSTLLDGADPQVKLPGKVDAAQPKKLNRTAIVDKSDHYSYFYENGKEVKRIPDAIGKAGHETKTGTFKVYTQLATQNMGSCDAAGNFVPGGSFEYCTSHVPYISYFNGDQGFHGAYWHNNFGNPTSNMSHGCVNLPVADAEWVYKFLQVGSTVTVRD